MKHILISLGLLGLSENAHAYLDPGSGSMLLQGLIAGLLAIGAFWRNIKAYLASLFSGNRNSGGTLGTSAGEEEIRPGRRDRDGDASRDSRSD